MICEFMGGGFGSKAGVDSYLLLAAELARRTGRPVRCALTRRAENMISGNRNATIQRVTAGARADGTLTVLGGEYTCALGWDGWLPPTAGPTQLLYACENVRTVEHGAKLNLPADGRLPRARLRRGNVVARVRARQARARSSGSTRSSCGSSTTRTPTRWTAVRTRRRA